MCFFFYNDFNFNRPSQTESTHSQRLQTPVQLHRPPSSSLRNTPQIVQQDEQKYSTCPHSSETLYNNGTSTGIKVDEIIQSEEEIQGPPLPPRPPLRPRSTLNYRTRSSEYMFSIFNQSLRVFQTFKF